MSTTIKVLTADALAWAIHQNAHYATKLTEAREEDRRDEIENPKIKDYPFRLKNEQFSAHKARLASQLETALRTHRGEEVSLSFDHFQFLADGLPVELRATPAPVTADPLLRIHEELDASKQATAAETSAPIAPPTA